MASALPSPADQLLSSLPLPPPSPPQSLPSPSSLSDLLLTPPPADPAHITPWPSLVAPASSSELGLTAAMPEPVDPMNLPSVMTPPIERLEPDMNRIVGGALAPVPHSISARPSARSNPGLQLPSFESLGIAVPRPESVGAFRCVDDDLRYRVEGRGRMAGTSIGSGSGLAAHVRTDVTAAIFDDVELENVLRARSSVLGGGADITSQRFTRSSGTRSVDPFSRRSMSGLDSSNANTAIDEARRGASQDLDRGIANAVQLPTTQKHQDDGQLGLQAQKLVNHHALSGTPACDLPLDASSIKSLENAGHAHDLPLTPPQENTDHNWKSIQLPARAIGTSLGGDLFGEIPIRPVGVEESRGLGETASMQSVVDNMPSARDIPSSRPDPMLTTTNEGEGEWEFVDHITDRLSNVVKPPTAAEPSNVSCQTLPSPLSGNRHSPLYTKILSGLQDTTPQEHGAAIRVWYLIRKGVPCGDGPVSPPATPRSTDATEDYFSPKVYDFLARTPDYQNDQPALRGTPNNVLPLASINISVVERYIPPTNQNEARQLFDTQGLSTLVDRLTELSPSNGCLIFIYPTKTGAQTFMNQYLDPVLGPILRSTMVVNNLPSDLSTSIGTMIAVNELPEYDSLRYKMNDLCGRLSHANAASRFHGVKARFDVVYEAVQTITLDRESWADWWTRQEKTRIREVVTKYLQAAAAMKRISNDYGQRFPHATELSQQIMTAVESREYALGAEPMDGVEVGVFVVQRSA